MAVAKHEDRLDVQKSAVQSDVASEASKAHFGPNIMTGPSPGRARMVYYRGFMLQLG